MGAKIPVMERDWEVLTDILDRCAVLTSPYRRGKPPPDVCRELDIIHLRLRKEYGIRGTAAIYRARRLLLRELNGDCCHYCGCELEFEGYRKWQPTQRLPNGKWRATEDHIVPRAQGGISHISNLVLACSPCNQERATKAKMERLEIADLRPPD